MPRVGGISPSSWLALCLPYVHLLSYTIAFYAVITSVSVLFASLVGLTISNLHSRQAEIHRTLILEVHYIRELQNLLLHYYSTDANKESSTNTIIHQCLARHIDLLLSRAYDQGRGRHKNMTNDTALPATLPVTADISDPHRYIESSLTPVLLEFLKRPHPPALTKAVRAILHQRRQRWLALYATPFPSAHYGTLVVLAAAIVASFLVATTANGTVAFGMPVRLLWAILWTSLMALGSVVYDLAQPFAGLYHVAL